MTEINFYHLTKTPLEKALPALLEKILSADKKAVLIASSKERIKELNTKLWTYSTNKFLPHGTEEDGYPEEQHIFLTTEEENPNNADILVMVDSVEPEYIDDFSRCFDIFNGNNEEELKKARKRWKKYNSKKYDITYWQQDEKGKWQKAA